MRIRLALSGLLFTLACAGAGPILEWPSVDWLAAAIIGTLAVTFAVIGALVTWRQARNPIGPLFVLVGVFVGVWIASGGYTSHVYRQGNDLPFGWLALWLTMWTSIVGFGLMLIVFLRFPNGALLTPRWRYVELAAIVGLSFGATATALRPGPTDYVPTAGNPLGVESLERVAAFAQGMGENLVSLVGLAAIASLVIRFRRSRGMERQQLKWFVLSVAIFPFIFTVAQVIGAFDPSERKMTTFLLIMAGGFLIPASMGVAILKYRLYEIDRIINRALVYGALTVASAVVYLGSVLVLQAGLSPITGESDVAVAASTLAVAATFRPLRSRLQTFIDRRFYRRKYDANRTVSDFAARLRDEVELDVVEKDIVGVVGSTVQPASVSLWLAEGSG